jgi:hypothetical protein
VFEKGGLLPLLVSPLKLGIGDLGSSIYTVLHWACGKDNYIISNLFSHWLRYKLRPWISTVVVVRARTLAIYEVSAPTRSYYSLGAFDIV